MWKVLSNKAIRTSLLVALYTEFQLIDTTGRKKIDKIDKRIDASDRNN
jgi:hypothetical protein